jgi:hypothetical protein
VRKSMAEDAEAPASPDAAGTAGGWDGEEEEDMPAARRSGRMRWAGARKGSGGLAAARAVAQREERERARLPPPIGFS